MKGRRKHGILIGFIIATVVTICFLNCHYIFLVCKHPKNNDELFENSISLMTFNIAAYGSILFTSSLQEKLLKLIELERPDVVCFQELSIESLYKIKPQLDTIFGPCEVLKGDNQMWRLMFYSHLPLRDFSRHKCTGDINIDDMTEEERAMVELSQKQMNVMSAEFEIEPGKWVTVFSGQLRSSAYSTARRSMDKDASWISGLKLS